jgi:hypothetical protein
VGYIGTRNRYFCGPIQTNHPFILSMKNTLQLTPLLALLLCSSLHSAHGAESELPVSYVNALLAVPVPASATTHVGLPFTRVPVIDAKEITAKAANSMTVAGQIPALTGSHSAQIVGGQADGAVLTIVAATEITVNSSTFTVITTVESVPNGVKADLDRVKIIPNWTLSTLLANGGGLTAGANAAAADKVAIETAGVVTEYYFNSTATQWQKIDDQGGSQNAVAIPLQGGIRVTRLAGANIDFVLHGVVRTGAQRAKVRPEVTTILGLPFASATTLASSGLADVVLPGADTNQADVVKINGLNYFLSTAGWRREDTGTTNQNAFVIPAGSAVEIVRKASTGTAFPRRWRGSRTMTSFQPKLTAKSDEWIVRETFVTQ